MQTTHTKAQFNRWSQALQEYEFDIVYKAGPTNKADSLSRLLPLENVKINLLSSKLMKLHDWNIERIREAQQSDPKLAEIIKVLDKGPIPFKSRFEKWDTFY
uniref:Uncharacterized protein n=1 Tax=Strigamia maritima TaxID=126957 RepID=T1IS31_STRMM